MAKVQRPTKWKIAALIDTSRTVDGSFPYRHAPQGYVESHGWCGMAEPDGRLLSFETPEEAQAWIDRQPSALTTSEA